MPKKFRDKKKNMKNYKNTEKYKLKTSKRIKIEKEINGFPGNYKNLMVAELKAQLKQTNTIISNYVFKNLNKIKTLKFNFSFSFSTFFMYENNLEGVKETEKKTINQRLNLSLKK